MNKEFILLISMIHGFDLPVHKEIILKQAGYEQCKKAAERWGHTMISNVLWSKVLPENISCDNILKLL